MRETARRKFELNMMDRMGEGREDYERCIQATVPLSRSALVRSFSVEATKLADDEILCFRRALWYRSLFARISAPQVRTCRFIPASLDPWEQAKN